MDFNPIPHSEQETLRNLFWRYAEGRVDQNYIVVVISASGVCCFYHYRDCENHQQALLRAIAEPQTHQHSPETKWIVYGVCNDVTCSCDHRLRGIVAFVLNNSSAA